MKNKGFTLVELIAIITLLATVIIVATPIVLNVIDDSKREAAIDSMYLYVRAIEMEVNSDPKVAGLLKGTYVTKDADLYTGTTLVLEVETKGTKPKDNGKVIMQDGDVLEAKLSLGGYTVIYKNKKATISDNDDDTDIESNNPYAYIDGIGNYTPVSEADFTLKDINYSTYQGKAFRYTGGTTNRIVVPSKKGNEVINIVDSNSFPFAVDEIILPNTINVIDTYALTGQNKITRLILPPSITRLENWVFDGATALEEVKFTGTTVPIFHPGSNGTFRNMKLKNNIIYVPEEALSDYQEAFNSSLPSGIMIKGY